MGVGKIGILDDGGLADDLNGAIGGDEAAFARLWRSLQPALLRYLRVVVGDTAEDVASDTWLQASRDLHRFDGTPAAFRVWLFRIARHRGLDERRRAARRRESPHEPADPDTSGGQVRDVAYDVLENSDTGWALGLIASLPPDQAEAVMLRVVAGLDVAQTAQVLGKRPGAVRVAAMRGLRRLAADPEVRARAATHRHQRAPRTAIEPAHQPEGV